MLRVQTKRLACNLDPAAPSRRVRDGEGKLIVHRAYALGQPNGRGWAYFKPAASRSLIGSFQQDRTFIEADVKDRLWSEAADPL
jgi:hypothetical protein